MKAMPRKQKMQIIVLGVLTAALVIVIFVQYALLPVINDCNTLNSALEENGAKLSEIQMNAAQIPVYESDNAVILEEITEMTKDLYPQINSEEFDSKILGYFAECSMSAASLSISNAETVQSDSATGVLKISADYSATGSYSELLDFISKINGEKAVVITSLSASAEQTDNSSVTPDLTGSDITALVGAASNGTTSTTADTTSSVSQSGSVGDLTCELSLEVYMYVPPVIPQYFDDTAEALPETADSADTAKDVLDQANAYLD